MNKSNSATILAYQKGYRVTDAGVVLNSKGRERKLRVMTAHGDSKLLFNVATGGGTRHPVLVHKLQAYQMFGDGVFQDGLVIRHLNGDPFDNTSSNLAFGSVSDNAMDRDPRERILHAQKAGKAASPHTDMTWSEINADHAAGLSYKKLRSKYGISLSTLSFQLSKTGKRRTLANR